MSYRIRSLVCFVLLLSATMGVIFFEKDDVGIMYGCQAGMRITWQVPNMKNKNNKSITIVVLLAVLVTLSLLLFGCPDGMADNYSVTFEGAAQIGGESTIATSTGLTLSFDVDPTSLAASDITVTGATKGELSDSGATRTLTISGITVGNGETVSVAIASPTGFTISGSPQTATVYKDTRTAFTFQSAVQTGGTSGTATSTGLTLSFDVDPTTALTIDNITVDGATKGTLSGSGLTRLLTISNITASNGETVSVAIASPTGFTISGSPQTATVYKDTRTAVTFISAVQTGGTSGTADSTGLTLSFDVDPTSLAASDITVTGATKGALTGSGTTRSLAISDITVDNDATVSVAIASPTGFTISGSPQTAVVYNEYAVGDLGPSGGHIFYDKGPVSDGWRYLEAAPSDLVLGESDYSHIFGYYRTTSGGTNELVGTDTGIGTGQANTTALVSAMGSEAYTGSTGTTTTANYAARLCDTYTVGIHGDWFLPSKDELNQMYLNLKNEGIGGFSDEFYWSSSEYSANIAWPQYFYVGNQVNYYRYYSSRVRPVRAF